MGGGCQSDFLEEGAILAVTMLHRGVVLSESVARLCVGGCSQGLL